MKCYFCNNECSYDSDTKWVCKKHPVTVYHFHYVYNNGTHAPVDFLHFTIIHKQKEYTMWYAMRPFQEGGEYIPCHLNCYVEQGRLGGTMLHQFDHIPNITPENFPQKLLTILTFL